jgi:MFS family permease
LLRRIFAVVSWRDRRLAAVSQAGLVEKFVDALVWVFYPIFLSQQGLGIETVSWVVGIYGFAWGTSQLWTGRLSDRIGRHPPNIAGMWICGAGVAMVQLGSGIPWWSASAAVAGIGMGLLYPNLVAAVSDLSPADRRGAMLGVYRFWRDLGYGIGGIGLGLAAMIGGGIKAAFWFVAGVMFLSGGVLWWLGEETRRAAAVR